MVITCPKCGHQGKVDPSRIPPQGARAKCPKCESGFVIKAPERPPQQPIPPAAPAPPETLAPAAPAQQAQATPEQPQTALSQEPPPAPTAPEPSLGFAGEEPPPAPAAGDGLSLQAPSPEAVASKDVACTGCLKLFKEGEITVVGDRALCQSCQESFQAKGQAPAKPGGRPAYGMPAKKPRMEYAGFWVRTGAYIVDAVILLLIWHFILSPVLMKVAMNMMSDSVVPATMTLPQDSSLSETEMMQEMMNQMTSAMDQMTDKMIVWVWAVQAIGLLLMAGYFIVLEGGPGQTIGKKALNLRVVTSDGDRIGYLKAFARYIGRAISFLILCVGVIMVAFDGEKRALHDRMVDTRVIKE